MTYLFRPAAEAEHLEAVAFHHSRPGSGLGESYLADFDGTNERLLILGGLLAIVLGVPFALPPLAGIAVTILWIGAIALVYGIFQVLGRSGCAAWPGTCRHGLPETLHGTCPKIHLARFCGADLHGVDCAPRSARLV